MDALKLFWGLLIILAGVTLIGVNAGWWNISVWFSVLALWPVILIVIGLKLLIKDERILALVLLGVVALLVVCVSAGYRANTSWFRPNHNFMGFRLDNETVSESRADTYDEKVIKKINVSLSTGAAKVTVVRLSQGTAANTLYQLKTQDMAPISVVRDSLGDTVNLTIQENNVGIQMMGRGMIASREITLYLPVSTIISLSVDSGASKLNFDFTDLSVENVDLNIGASSGDFYLSDKLAKQKMALDAGASSLVFHIPTDLGVKATLDGGLNTVNSDSALGMTKTGDSYLTKDFDNSAKQVVISGSTGVSSIRFVRK